MGVALPESTLSGNFSGAEELITLGVPFKWRTLTSLHTAGGCSGMSCMYVRGRGRGRERREYTIHVKCVCEREERKREGEGRGENTQYTSSVRV